MTDSARRRWPRSSSSDLASEIAWSRLPSSSCTSRASNGRRLADIAELADVPAGNVYYYFKTKDDVIAAVVEAHIQQVRTTLATLGSRS